MPVNDDEILVRIENSILKLKDEIKTTLVAEIKDLRRETTACFKELPCEAHQVEIKKNESNLKTVVIVLVSTGILGGGVFSALKIIFGG